MWRITASKDKGSNFRALEILDLVGSIDLFSDFVVSRGIEFVQSAQWKCYAKGQMLLFVLDRFSFLLLCQLLDA